MLGGRHGNECFNDVWVFDTVSETWQQLQPAPFCPRAYHTATLVAGNQLWVIGGNDLRNMLGDVHVLDTTTLKVSTTVLIKAWISVSAEEKGVIVCAVRLMGALFRSLL